MGTRIWKENGKEGPKHDPYGYERLCVEKGDKVVKFHMGLQDYVEINGIIHRATLTTDLKSFIETGIFNQLDKIFEKETGLTVKSFQKAYERINAVPENCPDCNGRSFSWQGGYPGETLLICTDCKTIIDSEFNEGAII